MQQPTSRHLIVFTSGEVEPAESFDQAREIATEFVTEYGKTLDYALEIERVDGTVKGHDRTEQLYDACSSHECEQLTDRFHGGGHNFGSLEGFLEVQEWHFPPAWVRKANDRMVNAIARARTVPVEGGGAVIIPVAAE